MYGMDSSSMSLLGFGAIVVVGAIVMYLVSLFSMKETSFEDVLEEQRKKKEKEDKERSLHNKQKREQYRKKFDQKKKKTTNINGKVDKPEIGVTPSDDQNKDAAGDSSDATPSSTPEPRKLPKAKPAKKQQDATAQAQQKQDSPKPSHPILKHPAEKPPKEEAKPAKKTAAEVKAEAQKEDSGRSRTVSFSDDVQDKQRNEGEQEKPKKKKKKEPEVENELVGQLKEAALSDRDVQNVLTMVKQKYGIDVGGGSKIKDLQHQLDNARKQLAQQEANLKNYVDRCIGAEGKIEQLKQDITVEKTKVTSLEKAVQDGELKRKSEVAAIQGHHSSEMKQLQDKIARAHDYEEIRKSLDSAKTENNFLREEVKKNATVISENQRLSADLKSAKTQLQEVRARCSELEQKNQGLSQHSDSLQQQQGEKEKHYLLKIQEQANSLQQMEQNRSSLDSELQKVKSELEATQSNSTKLLDQVTSLNDDIEGKVATQRALEQRLEESEKALSNRDSEIKNMTKQNRDLTAQVKNLEQQIAQLNTQCVKIEQETKSKSAADAKAEESAKELEKITKEKSHLKDEVDRLKKKNNDLRDRSWKAMDALSLMEKSIPEKVSAAKAEGDARYASLESAIKQSLVNAFPSVSVNDENFESWVSTFVKVASESSQTVQSTEVSSPELDEAKKEVQNLRNKLDKASGETSGLKSQVLKLEESMQVVRLENENLRKSSSQNEDELSTAEEVLRKLQSSVEVEEGVWKKKVEEAHNEASKAHQDAEDLRKTVDALKLEKSSLQNELKESEKLKKHLEEMTAEVSDLKGQLETAKDAVTDSLQQTEDLNEIFRDKNNEGNDLISPKQTDNDRQGDSPRSKSVSCQSESPVQIQYSDACTETGIEQHQDVDGFLVIEQVSVEEFNRSSRLANGYEDELAKLKERLDKEKTLTKNLGQAATKLQTVLKQTQEQLKEEKGKTEELERKLANGDEAQVIHNFTAETQKQSTSNEAGDGTSV